MKFKCHLVYDFMPMYYRYKALIQKSEEDAENGKVNTFNLGMPGITKLTTEVSEKFWYNTPESREDKFITKDISCMYYIFKNIEQERKYLEDSKGYDVNISVCFDSKSVRSELSQGYKAERKVKRSVSLTDEDFEEIEVIQRLMSEVGYNTYKVEGLEADDLVYIVSQENKDYFDSTTIFSNDKDLAINISDKIAMKRYIPAKGYDLVKKDNFEKYFTEKFKCNMKYNAILLYLSTVGDKVDGIPGIKGFGPKAYDKLVEMIKDSVDWTKMCDVTYMDKIVDVLAENYFLEEQKKMDFKASYILARPFTELTEQQRNCIDVPSDFSTKARRNKVFETLKFRSLVE